MAAVAAPVALLGTVIDGTGRAPLAEGVVLVDGETIVAVGARADVAIPEGATLIDVGEATILPGFINAHVHATLGSPYLLETWVQAGVTTVRDLGEPAQAPWRPRPTDPRYATVYASGPILTAVGGSPEGFPCIEIVTPPDGRFWVGKLFDRGSDVIKVMFESSSRPVLAPETTLAIVQKAHEVGLPVAVHATCVADLRRAIEAGVDDIAHMVEGDVPLDLMGTMVEKGIAWVPTLVSERREGEALRPFLDLGGVVAIGNDVGYLAFDIGMPMDEIRCLARAGMTPMEIVVAGTLGGARVLHQEAVLGSLEVGKQADILVVRGNPLEDLESLSHPVLVLHRGAIVRQEAASDP